MLETCGFTYDPALDAYRNGTRLLRVESILRHTELWVAQWITETLPTGDAETARRYEVIARAPAPAAARRTT